MEERREMFLQIHPCHNNGSAEGVHACIYVCPSNYSSIYDEKHAESQAAVQERNCSEKRGREAVNIFTLQEYFQKQGLVLG